MGLRYLCPLIAALVAWTIAAAPARADEAVDLTPREGVTLRVAVIVPPAPRSVVIVFTGGAGKLGIGRDGDIKRAGNFAVRIRRVLAKAGFVTMVPDVSSDRNKRPGLRGFRHSDEYTADLRALMRYARTTYDLPVWALGTSAGTISVAHAGTRLRGADRPDGLVFSSSITEDSAQGSHVLEFDLERYAGPVLIVHHRRDACRATPPEGAGAIRRRLVKASPVELLLYDGGDPRGRNCGSRHYHGFHGIDARVAADIAKWMLAHR